MANALFGQTSSSRTRREVWEEFLRDRELLARNFVTAEELETLKTCAPFGTLSNTDDILFILNTIRRSRRRFR